MQLRLASCACLLFLIGCTSHDVPETQQLALAHNPVHDAQADPSLNDPDAPVTYSFGSRDAVGVSDISVRYNRADNQDGPGEWLVQATLTNRSQVPLYALDALVVVSARHVTPQTVDSRSIRISLKEPLHQDESFSWQGRVEAHDALGDDPTGTAKITVVEWIGKDELANRWVPLDKRSTVTTSEPQPEAILP